VVLIDGSSDLNMPFDKPFLSREEVERRLKDGWEETAERFAGIPLYPDGELSGFGYIFTGSNDIEDIRQRHIGVLVQGFFHTSMLIIFTYNTMQAVHQLRRRSHSLMAWCCFIQSFTGVIYTLVTLSSTLFTSGASCRQVLWLAGAGIVISSMCVNTALLQKAYIVHNRNKKLLAAGIIMIIPQPVIIYMVMTSPAIPIPRTCCVLLYPTYMPWVKFALDAPMNVIFSIAFIAVVYRQYNLYGAEAWKRLAKDGIQTMGLIILCNFVCMFCVAMDVLGVISELFFILDWVITSSLLIHHCISMSRVAFSSNK
jgi:hypothetical protein